MSRSVGSYHTDDEDMVDGVLSEMANLDAFGPSSGRRALGSESEAAPAPSREAATRTHTPLGRSNRCALRYNVCVYVCVYVCVCVCVCSSHAPPLLFLLRMTHIP